MRAEVDVLTLTATPIPRTLHMSLTGIRDLSLIETAPCNRQVIRTYVANYEASIVREAILRELGRSGQVFFIHNRVQNIAQIAQEVQDLVPQARIAFAHGQMHERELERVMHRFISREIDVLVSTTIIESGLDIANANTIIIRDSDMFGLAELYQLRGRVGRSSRRAYAYLLVSDAKKLGPEAKKRLEVLQSLDDLGVGFRLALQDMEIRGAGNLLGKDQSGHIHLVGFELYSRILKDAVGELRRRERRASLPESLSEPARPDVDPEMHIGFPAHIPEDYVPDISERLLLYQRLTQLEGEDEAREMAEEIEDRFGAMPDDVEVLLELMLFRSVLRCAGIVVAAYRGGSFSFKFHPEAAIDAERVTQAVRSGTFGLRLSPALVFSFPIAAAEVAGPQTFKERLVPVLDELGCKCF
ncbi:MAG TPA: helicase-related protein [Oligoflexia bacterium]|nr:helicase-related protein [Oligoflexia bacterium]